jgi:hypothetical protein
VRYCVLWFVTVSRRQSVRDGKTVTKTVTNSTAPREPELAA